MDRNKSHNNNHNTSRKGSKRKHDTNRQPGPPSKKPRQEPPSSTNNNHQAQRSYTPSEHGIVLPVKIPALPSISPELEKIVFTHPGFTPKGQSTVNANTHYDRLEFLGDAYLEIIASRIIFHNHPRMNVGAMSKLRETVVKNETLSRYSAMYGFDRKLHMTQVPDTTHRAWSKVYGDVFEAYAAAVVLSDKENGEERLRAWLAELWEPMLKGLDEGELGAVEVRLKAKEELAKRLVCPGIKLNYVEERRVVVHVGLGRETYFIGVYLDGWGWKNQHLGSGEGESKSAAGAEAALKALRNHPLIDEVAAKKAEYLAEKAAARVNEVDSDGVEKHKIEEV